MTAGTAGLPSAPNDRAERYLFTALPMLGAKERRALAMAELTETDRATIAAELGVSEPDLAELLSTARKALRRTRAPLNAGGRCERTERLVSEAVDGTLDDAARARHDAHLNRCPRCREHAELLAEARATLRSGFAKSLEIAPASLDAPPPPVARPTPAEPVQPPRLRAVPAEPQLPPAAAPAALEPADPAPLLEPPSPEPEPEPIAQEPIAQDPEPVAPAPEPIVAEPPPAPEPEPEPVVAEPEPEPEPEPIAEEPEPIAQEPEPTAQEPEPEPAAPAAPIAAAVAQPQPQPRPTPVRPPHQRSTLHPALRRATTTAAAALILVALVAALLGGAAALHEQDNGPAPWANPTAPTITPAPLDAQ